MVFFRHEQGFWQCQSSRYPSFEFSLLSSPFIYSYLTERRQVVRIQSTLSEPAPTVNGVPQGIILGSFLFNMYTNPPILLPYHSSQSCDDDRILVIFFQMKETMDAFTDLTNDLHRIGEWCSSNLLLLNPSKTNSRCLEAGKCVQNQTLLISPSREETLCPKILQDTSG